MNNGTNKNPGGFSRFMDRISWFDERLAEFAGWIVMVMMVTITYDVAMRYIFGMPTTWSFEINRYMLILVMFFAGPWALPAGGMLPLTYSRSTWRHGKKRYWKSLRP